MTYQETIEWMFVQLPMYQEIGKTAFNGKLDNILKLCAHLGHPETQFKSIHVAGTNGKGSSSHMLASILQEAGYKVGLYTSPHLKDFRERIRINGLSISESEVVTFIKEHRSIFDDLQLSFFEMTVGMAFSHFAKEKVDIAIIEVGLGGRLDSTNIIQPEVALITNIGYDHMNLLGNSLEEIAREKAGIIKKETPVVVSEYQEDIAMVFKEVAKKHNAPLVFASELKTNQYRTSLLGNYQSKNIKGVITVLKRLPNFEIREEHIVAGLLDVVKNTHLMGRWQLLRDKPQVICDTAHNSEGLALVIAQLQEQLKGDLHFILGFVKDKNLDAVFPLFPKKATYYFCAPTIRRSLAVSILKEKAENYGIKGNSFPSVNEAYKAALADASVDDLIFIGGSNFTVAEVL